MFLRTISLLLRVVPPRGQATCPLMHSSQCICVLAPICSRQGLCPFSSRSHANEVSLCMSSSFQQLVKCYKNIEIFISLLPELHSLALHLCCCLRQNCLLTSCLQRTSQMRIIFLSTLSLSLFLFQSFITYFRSRPCLQRADTTRITYHDALPCPTQ